MINLDIEELTTIFRNHGLKLTIQRLAIFKLIKSRQDHPTTEKVYDSLKEKYPTISLATVYNTLHIFEELGLIQELNFKDDNIRYDPNMELHINIVCIKCGKIIDYSHKGIKDLWQSIISDLDFKPKGQRIDIYYECETCKNLETKK